MTPEETGTEETDVEIGAGVGIGTTEDGTETLLPDGSCGQLCCEVGTHCMSLIICLHSLLTLQCCEYSRSNPHANIIYDINCVNNCN